VTRSGRRRVDPRDLAEEFTPLLGAAEQVI